MELNLLDRIRCFLFGKDVIFQFKSNSYQKYRFGRLFKTSRFNGGYAIKHYHCTTAISNIDHFITIY